MFKMQLSDNEYVKELEQEKDNREMYDEQYNYTVHEGMFLVVCLFCPIFSMIIHVEKN